MVLTLGLQQCLLNCIYPVKLRYQLINEFQRYDHQNLIKNWSKIIIFYLNFSWKISTDKTAIHRIECSVSWGMKWTIQNPKIQKRTSSKFIFSFCVIYNIIWQKHNLFGWQKCVIRFLCFLKIVFFCFSSQKLSVKNCYSKNERLPLSILSQKINVKWTLYQLV